MLEISAIFAFKQAGPEPLEGRLVCTEDLAPLAAVVTVYQPDQVCWAKVVCECALAWFMRNLLNQFGQGCISQ